MRSHLRQQAVDRPGLVSIGDVHGPGDEVIVPGHEGDMSAGGGGEKEKAQQKHRAEIKVEMGGFHS